MTSELPRSKLSIEPMDNKWILAHDYCEIYHAKEPKIVLCQGKDFDLSVVVKQFQ